MHEREREEEGGTPVMRGSISISGNLVAPKRLARPSRRCIRHRWRSKCTLGDTCRPPTASWVWYASRVSYICTINVQSFSPNCQLSTCNKLWYGIFCGDEQLRRAREAPTRLRKQMRNEPYKMQDNASDNCILCPFFNWWDASSILGQTQSDSHLACVPPPDSLGRMTVS